MKNKMSFFILIAIVVIIAAMFSGEKAHMEEWCLHRGMNVTDIEMRVVKSGPWLRLNGVRIYRVEARSQDGRLQIFWFRFGHLLGSSIEKEVQDEVFEDVSDEAP